MAPTADRDALSLPHVAAMLHALDAGDDAVLPVLADALEERSDVRGPALRLLAGPLGVRADGSRYKPDAWRDRPGGRVVCHAWTLAAPGLRPRRSGLDMPTFRALAALGGQSGWSDADGEEPEALTYPDALAAFLALAAAR